MNLSFATSKELTRAVSAGISFESLVEHLQVFINRYSTRKILGVDSEDQRQEILVIVWKCWRGWDSTTTYSFLNYLIRAVENQLIRVGENSSYHLQQPQGLKCVKCKAKKIIHTRGDACTAIDDEGVVCGGTRWVVNSVGQMISTESLTFHPGKRDLYEEDCDDSLDIYFQAVTKIEAQQISNFIEVDKCIPLQTKKHLVKILSS